MISVTKSTTPRKISPNFGHIMLFLWISEDLNRRKLFEKCISNISTYQDSELITKVINQSANRCWAEFQDIYGEEVRDMCQEDEQYEILLRRTTVN